jgi:hypothetical protein
MFFAFILGRQRGTEKVEAGGAFRFRVEVWGK